MTPDLLLKFGFRVDGPETNVNNEPQSSMHTQRRRCQAPANYLSRSGRSALYFETTTREGRTRSTSVTSAGAATFST